MKITAIRATPVNICLEAPYIWSYGNFPGFTQTVIEIETDEGLIGLGEAPGAGSAGLIAGPFSEALIGLDAIDISACERRTLPSQAGVQSITDFTTLAAFGGVEMALWDLRGKLWQRPVCELLGGRHRDEVGFTEYFSYRTGKDGERTPEAVADYCVRMRDEYGSTKFEGKVSDPESRNAIQLVTALRKALGDEAMIRIDSNHAYSVSTARMLAPAFEELGVANWEDPVGTYEELAALRPHTRLRFSSHNLDFPKSVSLGVPDAIVSNIANHGGFLKTLGFIRACELMGRDYWCYSGDSGIGTAAYVHLCAASSWLREPNQSLLRWQALDVIEGGPFVVRNDRLAVPAGPGLGVTLDPKRLKHAHELFLRDGPLNKFADPDNPGVMRRLPFV